ncbi:MAG: hypothetical protein ACTSV1_05135 [Alphaproteobacteria bacterium]
MFRFIPTLAIFLVLAACSTPPSIYKAGEFNRAASDFGQDATDISKVTICYSAYSSTPRQVANLARDECGKFGKTAVFVDQTHDDCPLLTPVSANYICVGP